MIDDILMDEKVLKLRREIKSLMKSAGKDYEIEKELWQRPQKAEVTTFRLFLWFGWQHTDVMKKPSQHKIQKKLKRELKHVVWLEKNLSKSKQVQNSRKTIFKLYGQQHGLENAQN